MAKIGRHFKAWQFVLAIALAGAIIVLLPRRASRNDIQAGARLTILCDFLPTYVFVRNVVGDAPGTKVELLISQQAGCPHDYSLRPEDLAMASRADVIVVNGLGLDPFLSGLQKANPQAKVITTSDDCELLPAGPEGHKHAAETHPATTTAEPGDHDEHEHDAHDAHDHDGHDHASHEAHGHESDESGMNAHVWASPAQAMRQVHTLARKFGEIDPQNAARYKTKADAYVARLQSLFEEMRVASAKFQNRNIVTFHDAFAYLARDLNLNVVATLTQDPEYSPSAGEVAGVIDTIKKTHAAAIFYEPAYSDRLARTIGRDAGVPVYALNPVNSTAGDITPTTYEDIMRENLRVLQGALGGTP